MSTDLNSLIAQPQVNSVVAAPSIDKSQPLATTKIDNTSVLQQPIAADTFNTENPKEEITEEPKTNKVLDQILKYTGVAALVLASVALFVSHKPKNVSTTGVAPEANDVVNKLASQVKEIVDKNNTISGYIDNIRTVLVHSDGIDIYTNKAVQTVKLK